MPIINGQGRVAVRVTGSPSGGGSSSSYLLDTYGGAAAAYSLRKLSSTYSGSAIRVRRSSDNTEQNIGFDGSGNLDTTALTSFVGAGNGFVTTWYDQSGNNKNFTQTTASLQPTIVSAGSILLQSGKPKVSWNGNKWMTAAIPMATRRDCYFVTNNDGDTEWLYPDDYNNNAYAFGYVAFQSSTSTLFYYNPDGIPSLYINNTLSNVTTRSQVYTALNGYKLVGHENFRTNNTLAWHTFNIGQYPGYEYGGSFQEILIYNSDQSSNRSGINSNINTYYSIYPTDADAAAFVSAAGITDSTQMSAVNTLVTSLKSAGIWTKMKAIYPFVGGTASAHKFNLKDPRDLDAAFRLTFYGGWTHSSTGADPNGTTGYADTFVANNLMGQSNISIGTYLGEDNPGDPNASCAIGSYNSGLGTCIYPGNNTSNSYFAVNNSSKSGYYNTDLKSRGFYLVSKTSTDSFFSVRGNITNFTFTPNTNITTSFKLNKIGEFNGDYNAQQQRFAYIGDGLTSSEASALNTAVQAFQTTLGRQVA